MGIDGDLKWWADHYRPRFERKDGESNKSIYCPDQTCRLLKWCTFRRLCPFCWRTLCNSNNYGPHKELSMKRYPNIVQLSNWFVYWGSLNYYSNDQMSLYLFASNITPAPFLIGYFVRNSNICFSQSNKFVEVYLYGFWSLWLTKLRETICQSELRKMILYQGSSKSNEWWTNLSAIVNYMPSLDIRNILLTIRGY